MIRNLSTCDLPRPYRICVSKIYDLDFNPWHVGRGLDGVYVSFMGDPSLIIRRIPCLTPDGSTFWVPNTNQIFFEDATFGTYKDVCELVEEQSTQEIWESFSELFSVRFECDPVFSIKKLQYN